MNMIKVSLSTSFPPTFLLSQPNYRLHNGAVHLILDTTGLGVPHTGKAGAPNQLLMLFTAIGFSQGLS